jgi:hypothetical protein
MAETNEGSESINKDPGQYRGTNPPNKNNAPVTGQSSPEEDEDEETGETGGGKVRSPGHEHMPEKMDE